MQNSDSIQNAGAWLEKQKFCFFQVMQGSNKVLESSENEDPTSAKDSFFELIELLNDGNYILKGKLNATRPNNTFSSISFKIEGQKTTMNPTVSNQPYDLAKIQSDALMMAKDMLKREQLEKEIEELISWKKKMELWVKEVNIALEIVADDDQEDEIKTAIKQAGLNLLQKSEGFQNMFKK